VKLMMDYIHILASQIQVDGAVAIEVVEEL
jgi:hypothetical protein